MGRFPSAERKSHSSDPVKPVLLVLEGWLFLWRVTEPCRSHGGRIAGTADHPVNSGKGRQIVVLINLPHSLSTVRQYATVKEVRPQ